MSSKYKHLWNLPRPNSKRPPMPLSNRAAQFAPFAALTGFESSILEAARETQQKMELDEEAKIKLDRQLQKILDQLHQKPNISISYFEADHRKKGGHYKTVSGIIKKLDTRQSTLLLENGLEIKIQNIIAIEHKTKEGF
ncbi:MAG: YolD-like family protein [Fibrobacter sp.]|nr:YolD-like family protein [Fibrobacter sp.]